jgi:hypothetical protein
MIEAQGTGTEVWIVRLGAWGGVVGSLLAMVGNLLHLATPTGDLSGSPVGDSGSWLPVHLAIVGLILLLGGLVAIAAFAPATKARGAMFSARRRLQRAGEELAHARSPNSSCMAEAPTGPCPMKPRVWTWPLRVWGSRSRWRTSPCVGARPIDRGRPRAWRVRPRPPPHLRPPGGPAGPLPLRPVPGGPPAAGPSGRRWALWSSAAALLLAAAALLLG